MRWFAPLLVCTLFACGGSQPQPPQPPPDATPLNATRLVATWTLAPVKAAEPGVTTPQRIVILHLGEDHRFVWRDQTAGDEPSSAVAEGFWRSAAETIELTVLSASGDGLPASLGDGGDALPEAPVVLGGWFTGGHLVLQRSDDATALTLARSDR